MRIILFFVTAFSFCVLNNRILSPKPPDKIYCNTLCFLTIVSLELFHNYNFSFHIEFIRILTHISYLQECMFLSEVSRVFMMLLGDPRDGGVLCKQLSKYDLRSQL